MIKSLVRSVEMTLPNSKSSTILELENGKTEELFFTQVEPTKFKVLDADYSRKSGISVDIDIDNVYLKTTSKVLWPGESIIVRGGLRANEEPMRASFNIPKGKKLKDGVPGESWLYWSIETPAGTFKNLVPIHMKGTITSLPPKDTTFTSAVAVDLYDLEGKQKAKIYNCAQTN
ncbi:hypothetical protein [Virgibacillus dokdonensis]|uniref:hypothetical protein n=1 Tax=Virgibacillus dokdonensis TaxID=302167 RepID=UPI00098AA924|nr:hypothetical protein [Virgibacillus dokdonensis]